MSDTGQECGLGAIPSREDPKILSREETMQMASELIALLHRKATVHRFKDNLMIRVPPLPMPGPLYRDNSLWWSPEGPRAAGPGSPDQSIGKEKRERR